MRRLIRTCESVALPGPVSPSASSLRSVVREEIGRGRERMAGPGEGGREPRREVRKGECTSSRDLWMYALEPS